MSRKPKNRVDPVEVLCRIRPLQETADNESCLRPLDDCNILLQIPECSASFRSGQLKQLIYSFSKVFTDAATQKDIFDQVGHGLVKDVLQGKNGLLFTYGVTGSGKTYSMLGNTSEFGLLQHSLDLLFNSIAHQQAKKYTFKPDKLNSFELLSETDANSERMVRRDQPANKVNARTLNQMHNNRQRASNTDQKLIAVNEDMVYAVFISCVEIYNNYFYDLLEEFSASCSSSSSSSSGSSSGSSSQGDQQGGNQLINGTPSTARHRIVDANNKEAKSLKEDSKGAMYIKDVAEIEVKSTEEALELMHRAQKKRVVASTDLNAESSRSHSIFTIRVAQAPANAVSSLSAATAAATNVHVSQLSLVDLAGSERTKRTKNTGSRLREAGSINSSLMALRNCMEMLRDNVTTGSRKLVPYRDSKLTQLFKNYFEGNGKIKMILCINPSAVEFDETINVLKFSELVKDVLIPVADQPAPAPPPSSAAGANTQRLYPSLDKLSLDTLEQAKLMQLASLHQSNNYSLMNEGLPPLDVLSADDDVSLKRLIVYLEEFQRRREAIIHETDSLKQLFYVCLKDMNDEYDKMRDERNEFRQRVEQREREVSKSEMKIKTLEKLINTNNGFKTPLHQQSKPPMTPAIGGGSGLTSSNEKQQQQQQLQHQTQSGSSNPETPHPSSFRSSRITHVATHTHSVGRTMVNNNMQHHQPPLPPLASLQTPSSTTSSNRVAPSSFTNTNSNGNSNLAGGGGGGSSSSSSSSQRYQTPMRQIQQQYLRQVQQQHQASGYVKEGVPVANRRGQTSRRSKSAEMWLDHRPLSTAKIDTVMQPKMERKISVSKLELSDAKRSTNYVLTHQQQDDEGEVVTNLIKGKIFQSPSGGANVVFTDVETLQVRAQETPRQPRKRSCDENVIEDPHVVQDRCLVSIEGHTTTGIGAKHKIIKKTKV